MEEVNQELWELATENVTKRQDEAFETLFDQAVDEHLNSGDCADCEDGLCSSCESRIAAGIEDWQEDQFDDEAEAEYDRLEELRAELEEQEAD
jgi:ferredoxin